MAKNANDSKTPPPGSGKELPAPPGRASVNRVAKFGPDAPLAHPSPRQRLCRLLGLSDAATDQQVFEDAAERIELHD